MLKQEIIEKITKYFKFTDYEAERIYDDIFQNILLGVKDDNISEVFNLGEFILKLDDKLKTGYRNTIEFLPSANLEEELKNANVIDYDMPADAQQSTNVADEVKQADVTGDVNIIREYESEPPIIKDEKIVEPVKEEYTPFTGESKETNQGSIEDEIKKKRDEIIHKLDPQHQEHYQPLLHVTEGIPLNVPKPIVLKEPHYTDEVKEGDIQEEIVQQKEEIAAEVTDEITQEKQEVDEISSKSFSDYFKEVKEEQKTSSSVVIPPVAQVIPPAAIDLHKEITGEQVTETQEPVKKTRETDIEKQNGNGYSQALEMTDVDNSYYIWYKDSEPNAVDTQTMSYEYELLYQATKEAEYRSKLRIYVTTFILFFSIVLLLLIFSPVIYKYFFTTDDEQVFTDTEQVWSEENTGPGQSIQPSQQTNENNATQPVTSEQQNQNTTQTNEISSQKEQITQPQNIEGLVKTDAGWKDETIGVLYVQLENGKFAIQESAWNSEEKANIRIKKVSSYNIAGLTGSFVKVDLGSKGTWFRVRLGEFSTLQEAKTKAAELKSKGS